MSVLLFDSPISASEIGLALEHRRLVVGFTQQQLADRIHLPRHRVDHWESGHGLVHSVKLFAAFEACGVTLKLAPTETLKALLRARVGRNR